MTCIVEMRAAPGKKHELIDFCKEWMPSARRAGCTRVELLADLQDDGAVLLVEDWPTPQAFEAFSRSEFANEALLARYRELTTDGVPKLRMFDSLSASGS